MGIIETIKMITREEGREEGREKEREDKNYEFAKNLIQNTDFDTLKIASLVGVTEDFVDKVKQELHQ